MVTCSNDNAGTLFVHRPANVKHTHKGESDGTFGFEWVSATSSRSLRFSSEDKIARSRVEEPRGDNRRIVSRRWKNIMAALRTFATGGPLAFSLSSVACERVAVKVSRVRGIVTSPSGSA